MEVIGIHHATSNLPEGKAPQVRIGYEADRVKREDILWRGSENKIYSLCLESNPGILTHNPSLH